MKRLFAVLLVLSILISSIGCSSSSDSKNKESDVKEETQTQTQTEMNSESSISKVSDVAVGEWRLTYAEASGIKLSMEEFAELSDMEKYEMIIDIKEDGTFTASVDTGDGPASSSGTWTVSGSTYTLTSNNSPQDFKLEENQLVAEASGVKMYFIRTDAQVPDIESEPVVENVDPDSIEYRNDITYDNLARTPDAYEGEYFQMSGTVIQLIEGDDENDLRIAVNDNYDTILLVAYDPSITDVRVLEGDNVTVYGIYMGIFKYESTFGSTISVPAQWTYKITIN